MIEDDEDKPDKDDRVRENERDVIITTYYSVHRNSIAIRWKFNFAARIISSLSLSALLPLLFLSHPLSRCSQTRFSLNALPLSFLSS